MHKFTRHLLHKFRHQKPQRKQYFPHKWIQPVYGKKQQFTQSDINEPQLSPTTTREIKATIGTCLYYTQSVDMTNQTVLNYPTTTQFKPTAITRTKVNHLDYLDTHPDTKLRYNDSDMILHYNSDTSYLVEKKTRNRIG